MKLYIIAGESSGDLIGGLVMSALKKESKKIKFHGFIFRNGVAGVHKLRACALS